MKKLLTILLTLSFIFLRADLVFAANTHSLDLELDSSQYAYIDSTLSLAYNDARTIELWFKLESQPGVGTSMIITRLLFATNPGNYTDISYRNNSGTYQLVVNTTPTTYTVDQTLTPGTWYHLAITHNGATTTDAIKLYLDETLKITGDSWGSNLSALTTRLTIGSDQSFGSFADGLVDEIRVWNTIRTTTQLSDNKNTELVGNEAGLVAYYKLNNDYLDETSNNNDLTAANSPVFSTDVPFVGSAEATTRRRTIIIQ